MNVCDSLVFLDPVVAPVRVASGALISVEAPVELNQAGELTWHWWTSSDIDAGSTSDTFSFRVFDVGVLTVTGEVSANCLGVVQPVDTIQVQIEVADTLQLPFAATDVACCDPEAPPISRTPTEESRASMDSRFRALRGGLRDSTRSGTHRARASCGRFRGRFSWHGADSQRGGEFVDRLRGSDGDLRPAGDGADARRSLVVARCGGRCRGGRRFHVFRGQERHLVVELSLEVAARIGVTHEVPTITSRVALDHLTDTTHFTRLSTSLMGNPWDIVTSAFALRYYF